MMAATDPRYEELATYVRKITARKGPTLHRLGAVIADELAEQFPALTLADVGVGCMELVFYLQVGLKEAAQAQLVRLSPDALLSLLALVGERIYSDAVRLADVDHVRDAIDPAPAEAIPTAERRTGVLQAQLARVRAQLAQVERERDELLAHISDDRPVLTDRGRQHLRTERTNPEDP